MASYDRRSRGGGRGGVGDRGRRPACRSGRLALGLDELLDEELEVGGGLGEAEAVLLVGEAGPAVFVDDEADAALGRPEAAAHRRAGAQAGGAAAPGSGPRPGPARQAAAKAEAHARRRDEVGTPVQELEIGLGAPARGPRVIA